MLQVSALLWPVAKNNTTLSQLFSFGVAIHHILHWLPPVLLQARSAANRAQFWSLEYFPGLLHFYEAFLNCVTHLITQGNEMWPRRTGED